MIARSASIRSFSRRDGVRLVALGLLMIVALGAILAVDALPGSLGASNGIANGIATVDIRAPRALTYTSAVATDQRREEVRQLVGPQYDYSSVRAKTISDQQLAAFDQTVGPVDAAYTAILDDDAREQALRAAIPRLTTASQTTLASLNQVQWTALRGEMTRVLEQTERQEVRDTVLPDVRGSLANRVNDRFAADERALAGEILSPLIVANSTFDATATERAREDAANRVTPIQFSVRKGEVLVPRGQVIDAAAQEKLNAFGLLNPQPDPARAGGWLLLAMLAVVLLLGWIWRFRPQIWHRTPALLLIALLLIVTVVAMKATGDRSVLPYVIPTAAVGLLLAVLLDAGAALIVTGMLALIGGAIVGNVEYTAYVLLGGMAGIVVIRRGERLTHFIQAAIAIAIANVIVVSVFALLGEGDVTGLAELAGAGVASAIGSGLAAVGSFLVVGNVFGITTSYQLLELANPSQSVLRRLLLETPGTYHHSLMVGNLAERAAEAIGADPLLARVAAYYHDIGKLSNPLAFIENQADGQNIHDELTPEQSAELVKSHVAAGIDLAYKYKLPKPVIAFIPQHHGTALMSYFYARAKDQAITDSGLRPDSPAAAEVAAAVDERKFRHAGPKPQSREAAILMLADSVEASVRSLRNPDEATIRAMVNRITRERLEDGQFDECDLTLRDLEKIREAFVAQLLGMYHRRIEYPQNKIVELESRRAASGGGTSA
jgi:putative nucleotidyltransferase with HDIG domain